MKNIEELKKSFLCPKCKGRSCFTDDVSINSLPKRLFFRKKDLRYLLVTCDLCGYTEMYSLNVLAKIEETVPTPQTSAAVRKIE